MRQVSRRFTALIPSANRWVTACEWTNDGRTWRPADVVAQGSTVTASSTSQVRWSCGLNLIGVPIGADGINGYNTQIRLRHGMDGEPLLPFGVYKVTGAKRSSGSPLSLAVTGSSFETYLIRARFTSSRTFRKQSGRQLVTQLITEVLPSAQIAWNVDDAQVPRIIEPRERWALIDGDRDATSVARSLAARIHTTPEGNWVADPVPSLTDAPVWTAAVGADGVLISADEELADDGVYNVMVVSGQSTSTAFPPFKPGVAQDLDPLSPTYVGRPVEQGGFGSRPRFYTSQLITSSKQAQTAAQAMLAGYLGQRQKVAFAQLHNPAIEPGDVGIVSATDGDRRVLLDSVTYALDGSPLQAETRTTASTLAGSVGEAPDDGSD